MKIIKITKAIRYEKAPDVKKYSFFRSIATIASCGLCQLAAEGDKNFGLFVQDAVYS